MTQWSSWLVDGFGRVRRHVILVAVVLLIALVILLRLASLRQPDHEPGPAERPSAKAASIETEPLQLTPKAKPAVHSGAGSDLGASKEWQSKFEEFYRQHSPAPVRIVGRDGTPMAGFAVVAGVYPRRELYQKSGTLKKSTDLGVMLEAAGETIEYVTDENGCIHVEVPLFGMQEAAILAAARDWKDWNLSAQDTGNIAAMVQDGACAVRVEKRPQLVTLVATPFKRFDIPIQFADGRPFAGRVRIMLFPGDLGTSTAVNMELKLQDESMLSFYGIEGVKRGSIHCTSARLGFRPFHAIGGVDDAILSSLSAIVIPEVPAESQAGLVIDLTGLHEADGWAFFLRIGTTRTHEGILEWGKEFKSLQLDPRRGAYTARLEGNFGQVWDSGPITPVLSKVIQLRPKIEECCRVQCTVLTPDGMPLFPSFAAISENLIPLWELSRRAVDGIRRNSEGLAYGNNKGVIVLENVPPSVKQIHVEAEGHERVAMPVALTPGQSLDLGQIRLGRAWGVITVELVGFSSSNDLVAVLRGVQGHIIAQQQFEGRNAVKFSDLPFREYRLLIGSRRAPTTTTVDAVEKPIRLDGERPEERIVFDRARPRMAVPPQSFEAK